MKPRLLRTAPLGEVIAAAFDQASLHSTDLGEITRLATEAVAQLLRHAVVHRGPGPPASPGHAPSLVRLEGRPG